MKKLLTLFAFAMLFLACKSDGKKQIILRSSVGSTNTILSVIKTSLWDGKVGDEIRQVFGEHQVGFAST